MDGGEGGCCKVKWGIEMVVLIRQTMGKTMVEMEHFWRMMFIYVMYIHIPKNGGRQKKHRNNE